MMPLRYYAIGQLTGHIYELGVHLLPTQAEHYMRHTLGMYLANIINEDQLRTLRDDLNKLELP